MRLLEANDPVSDAFASTATGEYLDSVTNTLKRYKDSEYEFTGQPQITWMEPVDSSPEGSDFAMEACRTPGTLELRVDGELAPDTWAINRVFFEQEGGRITVSKATYEEVESC